MDLQQNTTPRRLIDLDRVTDKAALKKTFVYKLMSKGRFPQPIKVGRRSMWVETEVDRWIEDRIAERDGKTASASAA